MINLFFSGSAAGNIFNNHKEFGLSDENVIFIALHLYAGDISEPFNVSSRKEVYNAYFKLASAVSSDIRRFKQLLKKDNDLCIWYSSREVDEYLGMLATVFDPHINGHTIYLCDCEQVSESIAIFDENADLSKIERHLITADESSSFRTQWSILQAENAPLRVLNNGKIVSKPIDYADELIYNEIGDNETVIADICSELMKGDLARKLDFILMRIRQLIKEGKLEIVKRVKCDECYGKPFEDIMKCTVKMVRS